MKKIEYLSIILLFFVFGCSYNGNLDSGFHKPDKRLTGKIDLSAALVNTQELKDYRVQEHTGGFTYTFNFNPAYNEELVKEFREVFSNVQVIETPRELDKFNHQIVPALSFRYIDGSAWGGQYRYQFITTLFIKDTRSPAILDEFKDTQDIIITPSAEAMVLSAFTGLSLFLLSPITIPLSTQVNGNNVARNLEGSLSRSFKILSYQVANSPKIYNFKPDR